MISLLVISFNELVLGYYGSIYQYEPSHRYLRASLLVSFVLSPRGNYTVQAVLFHSCPTI